MLDIEFTLIKTEKDDAVLRDKVILPRRSTIVLKVKKDPGMLKTHTLGFENGLTGVEKYLEFILNIN